MQMDNETCYRAMRARDARFDGRFYVGVRTTGIYCRPVCMARTPRASSCRFFLSPAVAEQQGFRPCLICRPEIAPGQISGPTLAHALHDRLRQAAVRGESLETLSRTCGYSSRQVRRLILDTFGVTPVQLAQTERLLFAKRLIQETALPMINVAQSSGFRSLRRFNALFAERYGMAPGTVRRRAVPPRASEGMALRLAYRPPLAWPELLAYLGGRATPGVELADKLRYARTVAVDSHTGWIEVRHSTGDALEVLASPSLAPSLAYVLSRLRQVFDLDAEPQLIAQHLQLDRRLRPQVRRHPGLRVPGAWDVFEIAVRAILGQQVSVAGATTLAGRLARRFGRPVETPWTELTHLSPTAAALAKADTREIAAIGLPGKRAATIQALAAAAVGGLFRFAPTATSEEVVASLREIPGIGDWTAHYIAMRALRFPDAFPSGDLGLRKALRPGELAGARELEAESESWRPWRAYAAMHLWQSLS
ncbi:adenosine deaminase [Verrucomicrobia bacterium SCGC AG-212-E04]|nr:adenosine deaminase [Verrucomicrobia bacterium SCGC AG-212-E04]